MTSRMHTPHTTCPGCHEEVFLDELVGGHCPLCGYSLDDDDGTCSEYEETIERSDLGWMVFQFYVFKRFCGEGATPLQVMQILYPLRGGLPVANPLGRRRRCSSLWKYQMRRLERLLPKRCERCGRIFFRGGRAVISGDLVSPDYRRSHICPSC